MGVLLERQPEREAPDAVKEPSPVERMAGIVALLVMALVAMAGAAWQARRPSSLFSPLQPAGV
jgi:cobaltochelatase CobN